MKGRCMVVMAGSPRATSIWNGKSSTGSGLGRIIVRCVKPSIHLSQAQRLQHQSVATSGQPGFPTPKLFAPKNAPYTSVIARTYIAYNSQVLFRLCFCCYSRRFLAGVQFGNFDRRRMRSSKIIFDPWRCGRVARCHGTTSGAVSSVSSQQILQFLRQLLIWLLMVLYPPIIIIDKWYMYIYIYI